MSLTHANNGLEVKPITYRSCQLASEVLGRAFVDDPVSIASFQGFNGKRLEKALTIDFQAEIRVCVRRGLPIQLTEKGQLIAAAVIYPPGSYPLPLYDQWVLHLKSLFGNGFYDMTNWMKWLAETEKRHPKQPHFYLAYLGVDPEKQGMGYGSTLIRHLTDRADELGVGCYLENANPKNVIFYQRAGFSEVTELEIIGIHTWLMWRPARVRKN